MSEHVHEWIDAPEGDDANVVCESCGARATIEIELTPAAIEAAKLATWKPYSDDIYDDDTADDPEPAPA